MVTESAVRASWALDCRLEPSAVALPPQAVRVRAPTTRAAQAIRAFRRGVSVATRCSCLHGSRGVVRSGAVRGEHAVPHVVTGETT